MSKQRQNGSSSDLDRTQIIRKMPLLEKKKNGERIPSLIVLKGADEGRIFKLTAQAMSIGRAQDADICLNDKAISRKHCLLVCSVDKVTIIDLQSSNGTMVNDETIAKVKLKDGDKIMVGSTLLKFDLTDVQESEYHEKLYQMITFDDLSSLYNRQYMLKQLERMYNSLSRFSPFSLLFIDVDFFKKVNDVYGHITGSSILSELGRILFSNLRATDIPCRYGGEEFVVILLKTSSKAACFVAEKIRKIVNNHIFFSPDSEPVSITISVGIAESSASLKNFKQHISRSDEAMYYAKKKGRNKTVLFTEGQQPPFVDVTGKE